MCSPAPEAVQPAGQEEEEEGLRSCGPEAGWAPEEAPEG